MYYQRHVKKIGWFFSVIFFIAIDILQYVLMDTLEKTVPPYVLLNNTGLYVVKPVTVRMRYVTMFMDVL